MVEIRRGEFLQKQVAGIRGKKVQGYFWGVKFGGEGAGNLRYTIYDLRFGGTTEHTKNANGISHDAEIASTGGPLDIARGRHGAAPARKGGGPSQSRVLMRLSDSCLVVTLCIHFWFMVGGTWSERRTRYPGPYWAEVASDPGPSRCSESRTRRGLLPAAGGAWPHASQPSLR